jgi:hypothetical protein
MLGHPYLKNQSVNRSEKPPSNKTMTDISVSVGSSCKRQPLNCTPSTQAAQGDPIMMQFPTFSHVAQGPYQTSEGRVIELSPVEQRDLELLEGRVDAIKTHLVMSAFQRTPDLTPEPAAATVLNVLIHEFMHWYMSNDVRRLLADTDMSLLPSIDPVVMNYLRHLTPAEADLLRASLGDGKELLKLLSDLAPGPAGHRMRDTSSEEFAAVRFRMLSWVNTIVRDAGAENRLRDAPPAQGRPTPQMSPSLKKAVEEVRTPGQWTDLGGELAPHLITQVQGWPADRELQIKDQNGQPLGSFRPNGRIGRPPVILSLNAQERHYSATQNGRHVPVRSGGDCFFVAVLQSLDAKERDDLLRQIDGDVDEPYSPSNIASLRQATAAVAEAEPSRFNPLVEILEIGEAQRKR